MDDINNSNKLLDGEGEVGSFSNLKDSGSVGDNITPHHIPSDAYMTKNKIPGYTRDGGISINMEHPHPGMGGRHRQTATYDNNMTKAEQELYWNLSPREALAYDIKDVIKIYKEQGLYNDKIRDGLLEVIKQNKIKYPNLFQK
ncbi:hypothetical protein [Capnocytophaga stomatis]|uniref:hypothetical protein n=1 Tax=Capnocytophaga stomatis TaxID=1848904 RepID=UPI00386557DD